MDDLVPAKYISLFFTDLGVFTPNVVAAELAEMFEWFYSVDIKTKRLLWGLLFTQLTMWFR